MNNEAVLAWWLKKHSQKIKEFIAINVEFEELSPEALEDKRQSLLLEYLDSCESDLLPFLACSVDGFFEKLYNNVYLGAAEENNGL